jgi:hypothetical protein
MEILQCLQRRHWGFPAFLTYDVTKVVLTKVHLVLHMLGRHVYPHTVVSVGSHYKNLTKCVDLVQSGQHDLIMI